MSDPVARNEWIAMLPEWRWDASGLQPYCWFKDADGNDVELTYYEGDGRLVVGGVVFKARRQRAVLAILKVLGLVVRRSEGITP